MLIRLVRKWIMPLKYIWSQCLNHTVLLLYCVHVMSAGKVIYRSHLSSETYRQDMAANCYNESYLPRPVQDHLSEVRIEKGRCGRETVLLIF